MVLRRIEPMSCARISGILYALLGLVVGTGVSLFSTFAGVVSRHPERAPGMLFGAGAILVLPVLYGIMGFVTSLVGAWLYNVLAGAVGGIEVDLR
jgi:hypothetical protein